MIEKNSSSTDLIRFLADVPLFKGLSEKALTRLSWNNRRLQLPRGIYLFFQEDPADAVYVIRSGSVAITLPSEDGRELVINEMRPGDFFGEIGMITGKSRTTSAITRESSEVIVIPGAAFLELLKEDARIVQHLLILLAERLRISSERESALAFLDAPARLVRVLLFLDEQSKLKGYVTISQEELAQRTGLTRQTVARFLGLWRRNGWLITGRGRTMLLDRAALKAVMSDQYRVVILKFTDTDLIFLSSCVA